MWVKRSVKNYPCRNGDWNQPVIFILTNTTIYLLGALRDHVIKISEALRDRGILEPPLELCLVDTYNTRHMDTYEYMFWTWCATNLSSNTFSSSNTFNSCMWTCMRACPYKGLAWTVKVNSTSCCVLGLRLCGWLIKSHLTNSEHISEKDC